MLNIYYTTTEEKMEANFVSFEGEIIPLGYPNAGVVLNVERTSCIDRCPQCGGTRTKIHAYHEKFIHAGSLNETAVYYHFEHKRLECLNCNHTFMERIPELPLYAHRTTDMNHAIIHALAKRTLTDVSESYGMSIQTIKRILTNFSEKEMDIRLEGHYKYLSMDEIFLTRDKDGNSIYYWVLNDISNSRKVNTIRIDIDRSKACIIERLKELKYPDEVVAIAIDMWSPYKEATEEVFPNARIVIDPFHVIQTATREMDNVRKRCSQNSMDKKELKQDANLFTESLYSLTDEELYRLDTHLNQNHNLLEAYFILQELMEFYTIHNYESALAYLSQWESEVVKSNIPEFMNVLGTIQRWLPWIMNYFIYRISNGKTEGRNNLIRTLERQGFHYNVKSLQARIYAHDLRNDVKRWRQRQKKQLQKLKSAA